MDTLNNYAIFIVCMIVLCASICSFRKAKTFRKWFDLVSSFGFALIGLGYLFYQPTIFMGILVIVVTQGSYLLIRWMMQLTDKKLSNWDKMYKTKTR